MIFLILIILVMPFEKNPYLVLHDSSNFTVIKLLGILGVLWVLATSLASPRPVNFFRSPTVKAFVPYTILLFGSSLFQAQGWTGGVNRLIGVIGLLVLVLCAVRTEKHLRRVLFFVASEYVFVFPYALRQLMRFQSDRLGVGLYETNYYALSLALVFPLVVALLMSEERRRWRVYWFLAATVYIVSMLLAGSRGGFLGFVAGAGVVAFHYGRRRFKTVALFAVIAAAAFAIVPNPLADRLLITIDDSQSNAGIEASNFARRAALDSGVQMFLEHPLMGIGIGNFKPEMEQITGGRIKPQLAHNTYLEVAAESGVVAILLFLTILYFTYQSLTRSQRLSHRIGFRYGEHVAVGIKSGLVGWCVGAMFLSAQYEKSLWLIVFSAVCLGRIVEERAARQSGESEPAPRAVTSHFGRVPVRSM